MQRRLVPPCQPCSQTTRFVTTRTYVTASRTSCLSSGWDPEPFLQYFSYRVFLSFSSFNLSSAFSYQAGSRRRVWARSHQEWSPAAWSQRSSSSRRAWLESVICRTWTQLELRTCLTLPSGLKHCVTLSLLWLFEWMVWWSLSGLFFTQRLAEARDAADGAGWICRFLRNIPALSASTYEGGFIIRIRIRFCRFWFGFIMSHELNLYSPKRWDSVKAQEADCFTIFLYFIYLHFILKLCIQAFCRNCTNYKIY